VIGELSGRFTVAPPAPLLPAAGSFVASEQQLREWLIGAHEGDRCIYARVTRLLPGMAVADLARRQAAAGTVTLMSPRHAPGHPLFDYIARRTCLPLAEAQPSPPSDDVLTPEARRVLDFLVRLADQRAPCASNRGIACATGLRDADAAAYQLRVLADRGFIIRKPVPVDPGRIVTIVETGAQTALVGREPRR
jgi:DNA-binding MarR family transcriptional regulator